jgi:hypothetical protein
MSKRTIIVIAIVAIAVVAALVVWQLTQTTAPKSGTTTTTPTGPEGTPTPPPKAGPSALYPDASRTPGFANPDITQANISENICNKNWSTKSIRPPEEYTTGLKKTQMHDWGLPGTTGDYEEDHFISLELGGNPRDPRNLWPEPYQPVPGARQKDTVENYLHEQVCSGAMTLVAAQTAITTDWYKIYLQIHK